MKLLLLYILVFTGCLAFAQKDDGWVFRKNEEGVTVYSRLKEGDRFIELKVETLVNAPMSQVIEAIVDVDRFPDWVFNCTKSKIIKVVSPAEKIYYSITSVPWPMPDRDMVLKVKAVQDPETHIAECWITTVNNLLDDVPGFERMHDVNITWKLTPIEGKGIQVDYYNRVDPEGDYPDWLLQAFIVSGPYNSLVNFKKMIEDGKFSKTTVPGIID